MFVMIRKCLLFLVANSILLLPPVAAIGSPPDNSGERLILVEVSQLHMGMMVHLRVYSPDKESGIAACLKAFNRIAELNNILSDYEPDSELSRLMRQAGEGPVHVSTELFTVLSASKALAKQTDGLIDPTAAPLIRLWRRSRKEHVLPAQLAIHEAQRLVGHQSLSLEPTERTAELLKPGTQLDLGAIAKGYVGDEALSVFHKHKLSRCMFEAGGDMVFGDPPPGEPGWLVDFDDDRLPNLRLARTAASISGDTVQYIQINGRRYGHIIDPRTGEPVETDQICFVLAQSGLLADPLATLGTIMPTDQYQEFIKQYYPSVNAQVLQHRNHIVPHTSELQP